MRTEPADLNPSLLHETLSRFWGLQDLALTYKPVGFGSHHWLAEAPDGRRNRWFVTVDDHHKGRLGFPPETSFDALDRAMRTAATLRGLGLDFVVAPIPDHEGNVLHRLGDTHYSLVLFPYLDGTSAGFGAFASEEDRLGGGSPGDDAADWPSPQCYALLAAGPATPVRPDHSPAK